jgi:hypothetical protein
MLRKLLALLSLLAVPAAATALASCGAYEPLREGVEDAADRTIDTRTADLSVEASAGIEGVPSAKIHIEGDGQMDLARNLVRLDLEATVPGHGRGIRMEEIMTADGTVMYLRSPRTGDLPAGKEWIRIDLVKASKRLGVDPTALPQASQNDPAEMLRFLRAVSDVKPVEFERLDGVTTIHHKAKVDLKRYPDLAPAHRRADARRSVRRLIELMGGRSTMPMDVWVDEAKLVRRIAMDMGMRLPGGRSMQTTFDLRFSDFGSDVDVELPADGKTIDYDDLVGAGPVATE